MMLTIMGNTSAAGVDLMAHNTTKHVHCMTVNR